ncbi:MAG: sialate O-acetylesterase, partial [Alistipes sp.]|nr:sialate O-acetylesterase [Alistipes sp.]
MKKIYLPVTLALLPWLLTAAVRLPALVGDNMVLQRDSEVNVWGWAEPGDEVAVTTSWNGCTYTATAGEDGKWITAVRTPCAGGPYTVAIDDGESIVLKNVMSGEVWLCSGQSNMEFPLRGYGSQPVAGALETLMEAGAYPSVRLFRVGREVSGVPLDDCHGAWQVSDMNSAATFSAVGYRYAVWLHKALGVPVGIIEADWGGCRIESWMAREDVLSISPDAMDSDAHHPEMNRVAALYNGMLTPLGNYTLRGFLWYQGESNIWNIDVYALQMELMVARWRELWGGGKLPFYFVQLVPYDYDAPGWRDGIHPNPVRLARLREQQARAAEAIPDCGMVTAIDLGDEFYIHPARKAEISQRLALMALCRTYGQGENIDDCGPVFQSVEYRDGKAYVTFTGRSTLLPLLEPVRGFRLAGSDRIYYPAEARVVRDLVDGTRTVEV